MSVGVNPKSPKMIPEVHGCIVNHPTIGACWDADRLDLGRCGQRQLNFPTDDN